MEWIDYRRRTPENGDKVLCWAPYYRNEFVVAEFIRDGHGTRFSTRPGGWRLGEEYVLKWASLPSFVVGDIHAAQDPR